MDSNISQYDANEHEFEVKILISVDCFKNEMQRVDNILINRLNITRYPKFL
jgi:hypothetical protein